MLYGEVGVYCLWFVAYCLRFVWVVCCLVRSATFEFGLYSMFWHGRHSLIESFCFLVEFCGDSGCGDSFGWSSWLQSFAEAAEDSLCAVSRHKRTLFAELSRKRESQDGNRFRFTFQCVFLASWFPWYFLFGELLFFFNVWPYYLRHVEAFLGLFCILGGFSSKSKLMNVAGCCSKMQRVEPQRPM